MSGPGLQAGPYLGEQSGVGPGGRRVSADPLLQGKGQAPASHCDGLSVFAAASSSWPVPLMLTSEPSLQVRLE